MKLHLPKLLLSALLATFVVASYTYAEDISLNPLSSENGWDYSKRSNDKGSPTYSNGSITLAANWAQNLASWQQTGVLYDVGSTGEMTFSATLSETGTGGVLGLALVGSTQTIVLGAPKYDSGTNLWYAISDDVSADVFIAGSSGWENNRVVANLPSSDLKALGTCVAGTPFTIDGTVKRTQTGTYSLTLKFNNVEVVSDLDLGYTMDLSRVAFYSDGANNANATLSQLTFTGVSEYHIKDVIWNGQTSWNNRDQVWLDSDGNAVAFHQMDNVTFGPHAEGVGSTVTISQEVIAPTITVNDQYVFNLAENSILYGDITVNKDAGLALKGSGRFEGVLSGSGVLSFDGVDGLISGEANAIAVSELTITDATVATEHFQSNSGTSIIKAGTLVNIGKGGTLQLNGHDMLGWGDNSPAKIVLQSDDAEKLAVFDIQDSGSLTLKTALELKGNALVKGSSFNTYGTSIAVTGTNNEIASEFQARTDVTITVAADGELLVSGSIKNGNGGNHNITKSGDGILKITGGIDSGYSGTIKVTAGGLSTTKFDNNNDKNAEFNGINDYTNITTSGTGYVLLDTDEYTIGSAAGVSITKNYKVNGKFDINGKGYEYDGGKRVFTVGEGKFFDVTGALGVVSRADLLIAGGSVTAGSINLGHAKADADGSKTYEGYLSMTSGSLTTNTISFNRANHKNVIDITGGTVEFTTDTALSRGTNTGSTINITGTSADAPVVLKATKADWTLDGSGLTAAPTLGNIKVDADNTHAITLKNVALSGSVVNNATLNVDGAVTLNNVALSGNKVTLQSAARATVQNMTDISTLLTQLDGSGTLVLTGDAYIAGVGADTINTANPNTTVYDFAGNIEVTGGVLRLADNRDKVDSNMNSLSLEDATITLKGGSLRYFGGNSTLGRVDVDAHATLDVYATNGGASVSGTLTIKELDIASGKTLTLIGEWDKNVALDALTGDGELKITAAGAYNVGSMKIATLEAAKGNINFAAGQHEVNELDISSQGNSSVAQINLKEKAQLDVKTTLWMGAQASINLEDGASLTKGVVNIEGLSTENKATFKKVSAGGAKYSAESDDFIITGAAVSVKSDSTVTLGNNLQNSKVINAGVGELKLTHASNVLSAIEALAGDINLESLKDQSLESLYIGDELTVNTNGATLSIQEAAINQQGARVTNVTFGDNAKLQGNLVLQSGAALSLGKKVQIDGTLTLGNDMTLTGAQLEEIQALKESVELFHNVDQLKLTDARARSGAAVDYTQAQDLSQFFSNVDSGVYLLEFDRGVVYATLIPEPATGTMSLLALAALAARRRRRR